MTGPGTAKVLVLADRDRAHLFEPTISALKRATGFSLRLISAARPEQLMEEARGEGGCQAVVLIGIDASGLRAELPLISVDQGSWIRPCVMVSADIAARPGSEARAAEIEATRLALTPVAWEDDTHTEIWRELHAPMPEGPEEGIADIARPWALVDPQCLQPADRLQYASQIAASNPQWQFHAASDAHPLGAGIVRWRCKREVMTALLGKVQAVVTEPGPLCYDAWRLGKPVFTWQYARSNSLDDGDSALALPAVDARLAGTVPPGLAADPGFWSGLAARAIEAREKGEPLGPLLRAEGIHRLRGRQLENLYRPPAPLALARRRVLKLVRDPRKFLEDSRFPLLRRLGRMI